MKYKIKFGGRGADIYVHKLTEEKRALLVENDVENHQKETEDFDKIAEILGVDNVDNSELMVTGVYDDPDNIVLEVLDEDGNVVFDSLKYDGVWYFNTETLNENENREHLYEGANHLFVESYCKGDFFEFVLETEYFNHTLLSPEITEVGEQWELITGLYYDGKKIEDMEYGDYWGKGIYFYLDK